MRAGPAGQRGSAGLLLVWVAGLVVFATSVAAVWGGAVIARHRAGRVADLAAVAAAASAASGTVDPCPAAVLVAAAQRARVESCRPMTDGSVSVVVVVAGPAPGGLLGLARTGPARGRARAGQAR